MHISRLIAALAVCAATVLLPMGASAGSLKLTITDGVGVNAVTDNSAGDGDWFFLGSPQTGLIVSSFTSPVSPLLQVFPATATSRDDGKAASLHLDARFETTRAGTLTLTLEDTGFTTAIGGTTPMTLVSALGGVFSSNVASGATISAVSSVTNANGVTSSVTLPPTPIGVPFPAPRAFALSDYTHFLSSGPYSLFAKITIAFSGPGSGSLNFDTSVPVPELGTLLLVGSGLLGATGLARRRMSRPRA